MMQTTRNFAPGGARSWRFPFGRRGMILTAMAVIGAGMALNWDWLTAVGVAPLILALAPCAVMCGLGLCMMKGSKSCSSRTDPSGDTSPDAPNSITERNSK